MSANPNTPPTFNEILTLIKIKIRDEKTGLVNAQTLYCVLLEFLKYLQGDTIPPVPQDWAETLAISNLSKKGIIINHAVGMDGDIDGLQIGYSPFDGTGSINAYFNKQLIGAMRMSKESGRNSVQFYLGGTLFVVGDPDAQGTSASINGRLEVYPAVLDEQVATLGQVKELAGGGSLPVIEYQYITPTGGILTV